MKISLIEPRPPSYHVYSHEPMPRLGLPVLATVLARLGHEVTVYAEPLKALDGRAALDILRSDLVGISSTTATAPRAYAMARLLRLRGVPVVLGGVHPTFMPEEGLRYADYVIVGEAEDALPALAEAIGGSRRLEEVPGLWWRRDGRVVSNPQRRICMSLDEVPFPDWSLVRGAERLRIVPLETSRGCPHGCDFCCVTTMFGRRLRYRSVEAVLEGLAGLKDKRVFFCDDNFTASLERTKTLLEQMLRRGLVPRRWYAQVRADVHRDRELLDLMRRTRCGRVFIGFESISQEVLNGFHKHLDVKDLRACTRAFHDHGIAVHGMFVFGADQDDPSVFARTAQFAIDQQIDSVQFLILTPVPGSALFERLDSEGRIFTYDWSLYDGHHVVFEPARMSPWDLQMGTLRANRHFYSWRGIAASLSCFRFGKALLLRMGQRTIVAWRRANAQFLERLYRWQQGLGRLPGRFRLAAALPDVPWKV